MAALVLAAAFGAVVGIILHDLRHHVFAYVAATAFGLSVGTTELLGRYRDKPTAAVTTLPGLAYVAINGLVSLSALWLLLKGQVALPAETPGAFIRKPLDAVLLAGFGSMAFFRTSLFTVRVRDTDVAVGPAFVFQVLLRTADRACDRERAGPRAEAVKKSMRGVDFAKAKVTLPLYCLALMQNISSDEAAQLNQAIAAIDSASLSAEVKAYNLGLLLMVYVGEDVLDHAVTVLRDVIVGPGADEPPILAKAASLTAEDLGVAIEFCLALDPLGRNGDPAQLRQQTLTFDGALTSQAERNMVALLRLRACFGPDTVCRALALLDARSPQYVVVPTSKTDGTDLTGTDFRKPPGSA